MIELGSVFITLKLACASTAVLIAVSTPLAWWLATTNARIKPFIEALTALPLVLPPTVFGFYLLILFNPESPVGAFWLRISGDTLAFSFAGILTATVLHSLPFVVQPLQNSFESVGKGSMEAAASLGARPFDAFVSVAAPMAKRGFLTAAVLGFAHSVGEFGVILMVGGNIPGRTRVISIDIYTSVETLDYARAHILSLGTLIFAFAALLALYLINFGKSERARMI